MKSEKIFSLNSEEFAQHIEGIPELAHLSDQILLKQITGVDFYRMSPQCLLSALEIEQNAEVLQHMYALKEEIIDDLEHIRPEYDVFNGTVLELHEERVELCMPFHAPPVFMIRYEDLDVCPRELERHEFVQLLYVNGELQGLYEATPIPLFYVSASVNFPGEFQSLDFMSPKERHARQIFNGLTDVLPFDAPSAEIQTVESYSHVDYVYNQVQPISALQSIPASSGSAASIRLQPSFSNLALNTRPSMLIPEPRFFEKRFVGRVDFLIEQVGIIVMPRFKSIELYEPPSVEYLRAFKLSEDLGLVIGYCAGWFSQRGVEEPERGDIVEFTLVPGYGFLSLEQCLNDGSAATYPYINNYEENKNSKVGQVQKRQQTFAQEIIDFYAQGGIDVSDFITLSADQIQVVHRFAREEVCAEKMVHGQVYQGVVYTYSDTDNYGFIKSYGALDDAHSYAQGFEVYFKVQPQKCAYIPEKGDFVTFKSHWVDEKAQAREIKHLCSPTTQLVDGLCVAFYPPFVIFICNDVDEDLANNLFFTKYKQIPQQVRMGLKIGAKVQFFVETDISTQFKAVFQVEELKRGFSLSQRPSFDKIRDKPPNPFSEGTALTRIQPLPFVGKCEIFELKTKSKLTSDTVVEVSPYVECESGCQPPEYIFSNGQVILNSTIFYNQRIGIQLSELGYEVFFEGLSIEYAIFKENESDIRLAIARNQTPLWVIGVEQPITVLWTCRKEEDILHATLDVKGREVDSIIISGTISFKV